MLVKKLCYARKCIYHPEIDGDMYCECYVKFIELMGEGFALHLAVMIGKENNCVVSACAGCVKSIVDRHSLLPEYPENIDYVCNSFCYCYGNIWSFFAGMGVLNKCSRRTLINVCILILLTTLPANAIFVTSA